jgi:hypothetical protein
MQAGKNASIEQNTPRSLSLVDITTEENASE